MLLSDVGVGANYAIWIAASPSHRWLSHRPAAGLGTSTGQSR